MYRKMLKWFAKERREKLERVPKVIIHVVAPNYYCGCMNRVRTVILLYEPGRKKDTLVSLSAGDTKLYSKYADV